MRKGQNHTIEAIEKMRLLKSGKNNPMFGKRQSEETRQKIGKAHLGNIQPKEVREKISKTRIKEKVAVLKRNPFYGKKHSEKSKQKMKENTLGQESIMKDKTFEEFYGNERSQTLRKKISKTRIERKLSKGKNSPMWKGGISFKPYTSEFNGRLKKFIRERDNNICQFCGKTKKENNEELSVNHINYIKKDCRPRNLITLCRSDNAKVNYKREKWQFLFETLQEIRGF